MLLNKDSRMTNEQLVSNFTFHPENDTEKGILGFSSVKVGAIDREAHVIVPRAFDGMLEPEKARYYLSGMIARVAFVEVVKGAEVSSNFNGRSEGEFREWLTKTTAVA